MLYTLLLHIQQMCRSGKMYSRSLDLDLRLRAQMNRTYTLQSHSEHTHQPGTIHMQQLKLHQVLGQTDQLDRRCTAQPLQ